MNNINIVVGNYKQICKKIRKESLNSIIVNLPKEEHSTLKDIASSGIMKDDGYCTVFKNTKDFEDILINRTSNNDTILLILDDYNQELMKVCEEFEDRAFTIISKIEEPVVGVKEKKVKNIDRVLEEITRLCKKEKCIRTNSYFADKLKITTRTVSRMIKQLNENGHIVIKQVGNLREVYLYGMSKDIEISKDEMSKAKVEMSKVDKSKRELVTWIEGGVQDQEQKIELQETDIEKEYEQLQHELSEIPEQYVQELQEIFKRHDINDSDYFLRKILRAYLKIRTFNQLKLIVQNFFKEHNTFTENIFKQYLMFRCDGRKIQRYNYEKNKIEIGL